MFLIGYGGQNMPFSLLQTKYAIVYCQGEQIKISKLETKQLVADFLELIEEGYEMPAFGVALHEEVEKQKLTSTFVEFCFEDIYEHNDMPFCKLLIEVDKDFCGFNMIRYHNGEYGGRCFYINLNNKTMQGFYEKVMGICCQSQQNVS